VAANVWTNAAGSLGAGAFVGYGAAPRTRANGVVTNPAVMSIPAGISVGYKRELGTVRGWGVYLSPMYAWTRTDSGSVASSSAFRFAAGVDFAFNQSMGVTVGGDFGARSSAAGSSVAAAFTFVPGRR
jgi:hypothetical protein